MNIYGRIYSIPVIRFGIPLLLSTSAYCSCLQPRPSTRDPLFLFSSFALLCFFPDVPGKKVKRREAKERKKEKRRRVYLCSRVNELCTPVCPHLCTLLQAISALVSRVPKLSIVYFLSAFYLSCALCLAFPFLLSNISTPDPAVLFFVSPLSLSSSPFFVVCFCPPLVLRLNSFFFAQSRYIYKRTELSISTYIASFTSTNFPALSRCESVAV